MKLGCIADDFTGATDLANNLVRAGMRTVQTIGIPAGAAPADAEAVVVALKSRTIAPAEAVAQSLAALRWLRENGARQIYFKVCSTFDSTDRGNIGPVTEALMDALGCSFTIACPAFPANGRTVYKGYLFTGDVLLSEGSMRAHPLTPMTDPSLVRVMQRQCRRRVGLIEQAVVRRGSEAIAARMQALQAEGIGIAIVDALDDDDLHAMGRAFATLPLLTAGSGVAIGLPANFGIAPSAGAAALPAPQGARAVVSGSCSAASNAQVAAFLARHAGRGFAIDPLRIAAGQDVATEALDWALPRLGAEPLLVHATAAPDAVKASQAALGVERAGALVEETLARVAEGLVRRGVAQLVVAGGETSGACVQALGVRSLRIGAQIDPGVPWCHADTGDGKPVHLALKSGNFGGTDFFDKAFEVLR
ncbi:3-oxo-tetronate kinase [uncultured Piscinibacter sp.]|uniref:3-oxo-tetronate kinase n=1 Tax=uncultured Piscinibacter sp. TaxID=1131835 RepID=UPI002607B341|nr:3-oxo-tetronate kinase [uncultured Piscinibacter sp.]